MNVILYEIVKINIEKIENKNIKIIGVEPLSSPFITTGKAGKHKIQGIGAGFVPSIYDNDVVDEIFPVANEDAGIVM